MGIGELSQRSGSNSIEAFHFLLNEPFTSTVRLDLNHGYEIQWMNRRFALGSNLSLHKVQTCFQGSTPFNSADLLAVTVACLNQLSNDIHDRSTSKWKQVWDVDETTQGPKTPTHEDHYRNVLLFDLKQLLSEYGIEVFAKGRYSHDKRSDIQASFRSEYSLQIDIKKNTHRSLWSGIKQPFVKKT